MQRMNCQCRTTVFAAFFFAASCAAGGCQRGESESDKPEVRDLQIDVDVGESFDPAAKPGEDPATGESKPEGEGQ